PAAGFARENKAPVALRIRDLYPSSVDTRVLDDNSGAISTCWQEGSQPGHNPEAYRKHEPGSRLNGRLSRLPPPRQPLNASRSAGPLTGQHAIAAVEDLVLVHHHRLAQSMRLDIDDEGVELGTLHQREDVGEGMKTKVHDVVRLWCYGVNLGPRLSLYKGPKWYYLR